MRWLDCILLLSFFVSTFAQFGEIASLATSLLGGALGNGAGIGALAGAGAAGAGAAGQAGGALAQIGQLYQLAQGALQLTGTGVGVLNQASEGNWFPAVLEQTAKNSQALMKSGQGINLGALGPTPGKGASIGPEFGTSFPAPDIDDYDENAEIPGVTTDKKTPKAPDGLVDIEEEDYELETTKGTTTTLIPSTSTTEAATVLNGDDEDKTTTEPTTVSPRKIRIQLPNQNGSPAPEEELDYEDLINKKSIKTDSKNQETELHTIDAESQEELKKNIIATHGTKTQPIVPKLDKLVEVLQKSKLSKEEIDEIVAQVEGNRHIEKPAKYDFNAAVQNIPDKKNKIRQKITDASRIINTNFENQRKEQTIEIQKKVAEFKVLPDVTEQAIVTTKTPVVVKTTALPITTTVASTTTITKRVQQTRSVPQTAPVVAPSTYLPPVVQPTSQHQSQGINYLQPQQKVQQVQQGQQQQIYYIQPPLYGLQTQNFWNQQNQFVPRYDPHNQQPPQQSYLPQQAQFGYTSLPPVTKNTLYQQLPQSQTQINHYSQFVPQPQPQQLSPSPTYYATNVQNQVIAPQRTAHFPEVAQQRPYVSQQAIYQQGNALPTPNPLRQQSGSYGHQNRNPDQIVHYYHDGKQIVQQIIPKQIAATSNLPLDGPFRSQNAVTTDPVEYQRRQLALQQAYHKPQTRGTVTIHPPPHSRPKVYESTVIATGHSHAHAIRTYQATKPTGRILQPAAATRSSGRVSSTKKRISGHVLPEPAIDHRSILEKRTTAKPRYVRVP